MNTEPNSNSDLALLERTLDAFGSDPMRWPAERRQQLASCLTDDPRAGRRIEREQAFEKVLASASGTDHQRLAELSERIIDVVTGDTRTKQDAEIIQWPGPVTRQASTPPPVRLSRHPVGTAPAAALLAASLLIGIFAGSSEDFLPFAQNVVDTIGIAADIDPSASLLGDETSELSEWEIQ